MTVALAVVVGLLAGRLVWLLLRPTFALPLFRRDNYRHRPVITAAGVVVALVVAIVTGLRGVIESLGLGRADPPGLQQGVMTIALGFALLGVLDDLAGAPDSRGFRGHLTALARGSMTTGALKLLAGLAVGLAAARAVDTTGAVRLLVDGALLALAANLANLFDRAPGRTSKIALVIFVALAATTGAPDRLGPTALAIGAMGALFLEDLHERVMLGDAGANVVGGLLGFGVVATCSPLTRAITVAGLLVLNVASEWVSFSGVIDAVSPLRLLDRAGRRS